MITTMPWTAGDIPDQSGRTILVTGANSGLGLRSAEALAAKGAKVLMACRNQQKAAAARESVAAAATGPEPEIVPLDLSDLSSVRGCADLLLTSLPRLDVLMNNAGVMAIPLARTAQGFEMQIGTNHLGHFALTGRLLPLLLAAEGARVVSVSSNAHKLGRLDLDDLNYERKRYFRWAAYAQSKLADLLFIRELARRVDEAKSDIIATCGHPGYAATNLTQPGIGGLGSLFSRGIKVADKIIGQSDAMGALPQLYAATAPDVLPDSYWGPNGYMEQRGYPAPAVKTGRAQSDEDSRRLWELSEQLTGVTYDWS